MQHKLAFVSHRFLFTVSDVNMFTLRVAIYHLQVSDVKCSGCVGLSCFHAAETLGPVLHNMGAGTS